MTRTSAEEFDFPKGDKNVYATYQGKGGVHINSFMRRLLFAIEFKDPQILLTTYLFIQFSLHHQNARFTILQMCRAV